MARQPDESERRGPGGRVRSGAEVRRSRAVEAVVVRVIAGASVLTIVGLLMAAVVDLHAREGAGLAPPVRAAMEQSGVANEVTAVLLNFRSYDTLLEIGVLLLAAVAVLTLRQQHDVADMPHDPPPGPVLGWLVRLGVPAMVLGAGYVLWSGSRWPGGAFQAGAMLGAAGVVLRLSGRMSVGALRGMRLRVGLVLGFAVFALVGLMGMASGGRLLEYPTGWATLLIVTVEAVAAVSIGLTLALLFIAGEVGATGNGHRTGRRTSAEQE